MEGTPQGRGAEQGAAEAAAGDPAGTATVRRPRTVGPRRRKAKSKARGQTSGTTRGQPTVLCQFMGAQAGHHQLVSVVPATDGGDLEDQEDLERRNRELQPD